MGNLIKALEKLESDGIYPFHMPGHKRKADWLNNPYKYDITEITGLDDLHNPDGLLKDLQNELKLLYGCKEAFLMVNGSTGGILASVSAVIDAEDKILVARNCHKSVYNAVYLRRGKIEYIYPHSDTETGISLEISSKEVENILEKDSKIKAVVITSPTYEGVISNIDEIAKAVHRNGGILIVDAAHGAHIGLLEGNTIASSKADIIVMSLHKTLPCFTQTAIVCVNNMQIVDKVKRYIGIFETSSPSYLFMAGAEACIDYLNNTDVSRKHEERIKLFRSEIKKLSKLKLFETNSYDFSKIVIVTEKSNINGIQLKNLLLNKYSIELEMATAGYALAMTSIMDTEEGFRRLKQALFEIDKELEICDKQECYNIPRCKKLYEAWECDKFVSEELPFVEAKGCICNEYVYVYPPGIPIIVPGEIITADVIEVLLRKINSGQEVKGIIDNINIKVILG